METLIVQPENKQQLTGLKTIKVDKAKFAAKMKKSEKDVKAGRTTKIEPVDIWNLAMDETDRILAKPAMVKHLDESIQQVKDGKGVTISLDDI